METPNLIRERNSTPRRRIDLLTPQMVEMNEWLPKTGKDLILTPLENAGVAQW